MPTNRMQDMIRDYRRLRSVVPLGTLRTKKDYDRAVASLDAILDEIGEDEWRGGGGRGVIAAPGRFRTA